jgi:hypothetical protein
MDLYHLRQGLHVIASSWDYHGGAESRVSVRGNSGRFTPSPPLLPVAAGLALRLHPWRGESLQRGGANPGDGTTISGVDAAGARLLRRPAPPPRAPRPCLLTPSHEDAMCRRPRRRPPDLSGRRRRTGPAEYLPLQAAHMQARSAAAASTP